MKKIASILSLLLALAMLLALAGCGSKPAEEPAAESSGIAAASALRAKGQEKNVDPALAATAGEYSFFCSVFSPAYVVSMLGLDIPVPEIEDQYVSMPEMESWTVTLKDDGTGYLFWGDENQGPIDWWTMDGEALQFQAGVSVVDGTIRGGIMTLMIEEGFSACFAAPGADTSAYAPISVDELASRILGTAPEEPAPEPEPAAAWPTEGEYSLFAEQNQGYLADAGAIGDTSVLSLYADGTGYMTVNENAEDITSWTAEGGALKLSFSDGSTAGAVVHDGILEVDIWENGELILFYAQAGADTSAYAPMSLEELQAAMAANVPDSRLYAMYTGLDPNAGIHLRYDMHSDYLDSNSFFDVHTRDGVYYSHRVTEVADASGAVVTFFRDGTVYNLYPDEMRGNVATEIDSESLQQNILMMDGLYAAMTMAAPRTDYAVETREVDGASYTVEIFPAQSEYQTAGAFYFRDDGTLAYYLETPAEASTLDIGESFYTVYAIDGAVDDALFDISGYTIE